MHPFPPTPPAARWAPARLVAIFAVLAVAGTLTTAAPARAATSVCSQFGTAAIANGRYVFQQDEWNSSLAQCVSVDQTSGAWSITQAGFSMPTNGSPATYPSTFRGCHWGDCTASSGLPIQVGNLGRAVSSWSTTQVPSGAYDVAYDIWTNTTPTTSGQPNGSEIMIWLNSRGGVQPAGTKVGTVSISGATWNVWTQRMSGWNYIAYQRATGVASVAYLHVGAFIRDSVERGATSTAWYLVDCEAGFEIWQGGQGLGTNSFSFTATARTGAISPQR